MPSDAVILNPEGGGAPVLIRLDGDTAEIAAGGNGLSGDLVLRASTSQTRVHIDGHHASLWLGGNGADGDIILFPSSADANNDLSQATIHLDGAAGDIKLLNADFAEDFDISDTHSDIDPGTVMTLSRDGRLQASDRAYDHRVVGVVSGAGVYKPAIVLDRQPASRVGIPRLPVALVGKVYCKVEADRAAVEIGDMLTTSSIPGHAMKAEDSRRAFGAVLGKALQPLTTGRDLVPILVALQ
jgi:hypothetical protein